jgi:hypothetical protein
MDTDLQKVARLAMRLGHQHLDDYGAVTSRHDFTQRQLMACLVLKAYLKTTYRGIIEMLQSSEVLRAELGLEEGKLPHYSTLAKFSGRSAVLQIAQQMVRTLGRLGARGRKAQAAAMDSTGLSAGTASEHFRSRSRKPCCQWVKVSVMVWCTTLLPMALCLDLRPGNDRAQAGQLIAQARKCGVPTRLYADAGYDAEWIHERCRQKWGVQSVIKPAMERDDGTRGGRWRSLMSPAHLKKCHYGQRWAAESFFSAMKRKVGSHLASRRPNQLLAEAAFKVPAYSIYR